MSLALGVDESVQGAALPSDASPTEALDARLGHCIDPARANARVVFASFQSAHIETYADYNRVLSWTNTDPLRTPGEGESYPDASGLGTDLGLTRDTSTLVVAFDESVRAVRVYPSLPLRIFSASGSGINVSILAELGVTTADDPATDPATDPTADPAADPASGVKSASLLFPPEHSETRMLAIECTGPCELRHLAFFAAPRERMYAVFPMLPNRKPLPYVKGRFGTRGVTRLGGVHTGSASLWTCEVLTDNGRNCLMAPVGDRASGEGGPRVTTSARAVDINCLSIEETYVQESIVYEALIRNCNVAFGLLGLVERACVRQLEHARALVRSVSATGTSEQHTVRHECHVDCAVIGDALYINGTLAPDRLHFVHGITYVFSHDLVIDGVPMRTYGPSPRVSSDTIVPFGIVQPSPDGGSTSLTKGVIVLHPAVASLEGIVLGNAARLTLPSPSPTAHQQEPQQVEDTEVARVSEVLREAASHAPPFGPRQTPNVGNTVSHATFVHADGEEMTCEQALFLPGEEVSVSVYCSVPQTRVEVFTDGDVQVASVVVGETQYATVRIVVPETHGVHSLSSTYGSHVLYRVSQRSSVYAPIHPRYYTSGQMEGDPFGRATVELVHARCNFDKLPSDGRVHVSSSSARLVTIPDVVFDGSSAACTAAYFCRHGNVDVHSSARVPGNDVSAGAFRSTHGYEYVFESASWEYCTDAPWLACIDVTRGWARVCGGPCDLGNVVFRWRPPSADAVVSDVTLLEGTTDRMSVRDGSLVMLRTSDAEGGLNEYQTSAIVGTAVLPLGRWTCICFTRGTFFVGGERMRTEQRPSAAAPHRAVQAHVVACDAIDPQRGTLVFGTCPAIRLEPLFEAPPGSVRIPVPALHRVGECVLVMECGLHDIDTVTLRGVDGDSGDGDSVDGDSHIVTMEWTRLGDSGASSSAPTSLTTRCLFRCSSCRFPRVVSSIHLHHTTATGSVAFDGHGSAGAFIRYAALEFGSAGHVRTICLYSQPVPMAIVRHMSSNEDTIFDFERRLVEAVCTNTEQRTVSSVMYSQETKLLPSDRTRESVNTGDTIDASYSHVPFPAWLTRMTPSSFFVTPPSLILMRTSQQAPYSIHQSLLLIFNRRVEAFVRDESELFTLTGSNGSVLKLASRSCTLLSSQISIANAVLELVPATTYEVRLEAGRLRQYAGRVPCIGSTVRFSTL